MQARVHGNELDVRAAFGADLELAERRRGRPQRTGRIALSLATGWVLSRGAGPGQDHAKRRATGVDTKWRLRGEPDPSRIRRGIVTSRITTPRDCTSSSSDGSFASDG